MDAILGGGASLPSQEWPGASSRWHIQAHRRVDAGPDGPSHWPQRPIGVGNFMNSVESDRVKGKLHMYDPPSGIMPPADRETQWRSTIRYLQPKKSGPERPTGTKRVTHPIPIGGMGWTGTNSNFTGPRHFQAQTTTIEPVDNTSTSSYFVEQSMGMKKFVLSSTMGLSGLYEEGERRCLRPATEWSLDKRLQRKIRVDSLEERRNGIGSSNPGDKGYATAEHAPEYAARMVEENRSRGNMTRKVMSKVDASWSRSATDALLDKKGRKMSDYIQIYCKTVYRKNSMYVHRNAALSEIAEMAGEGGTGKMQVIFKGKLLDPDVHLLECGITAKCTVDLISHEEAAERKVSYTELERARALAVEADAVASLNTLDLETKYPAAEREEYAVEAEGDAENDES